MQTQDNVNKEILGLERKYWTAMVEKDEATAMDLTDFPCLVTSSHGMRSVDKEEFLKMFRSNVGSVRTFELDEANAEVRMVGPDTAIVAYKVHSQFKKDGQDVEIDAIDTSTWIRRNGKWSCAMHTETESEA